jgi:aminoglycoside phosphotransferase (APT) family kinase protein
MSGLAGTVPVPHMYALCEDESVIGRAFYIMEFMEGRVLWDQSLPGMTPAARRHLRRDEPRDRGAAHVKFAERGLADYGKSGNYFERQIGRWSKQYVASITQPIPEMDRLMVAARHMPASARDESRVSIVHGDFRLDNLMFHPTEPRVCRAGLGAVHAGPPAGRLQLPLHGWHIPRAGPRHRGLDRRRWASHRAEYIRATASAPAWPRPTAAATGTSTWPTTCSASRPSCKALPSAWRPALPPAPRPRPRRRRAALAEMAWGFAQTA